jgi:hypothetical protein
VDVLKAVSMEISVTDNAHFCLFLSESTRRTRRRMPSRRNLATTFSTTMALTTKWMKKSTTMISKESVEKAKTPYDLL